jgi:hypothetical protein
MHKNTKQILETGMIQDIKDIKVGGIYKLENGTKTRYFIVLEVGTVIRPGDRTQTPFKGAIIIWYKKEKEQFVPKTKPKKGVKKEALPWVHLQNATLIA